MKSAFFQPIFFNQLPQLTGGKLLQLRENLPIGSLIIDSRKAFALINSLFLAINGIRHDGHKFIPYLYRLGCRQFIIEKEINITSFPEGNFLLVNSSIRALQQIVTAHRNQFSIPTIGIGGSNGKTIVKEWLYQILSPDYSIIKNPGSYNSQLGVPLSVWQIGEQHNMGIFEAGISTVGEMKNLAAIINPTIGIFTNLLTAHDEGFQSQRQKTEEKALLYKNCSAIIYCKDHELIDMVLAEQKSNGQNHFSWGYSKEADMVISKMTTNEFQVICPYGKSSGKQSKTFIIQKHFSDAASLENLFHCVATMIYLEYASEIIEARIAKLKSLPMRLEMKEGLNGCTIIDDSYSNDLAGLKIALDFLHSQRKEKNWVILSDMEQSGLEEKDWVEQVNHLLKQHKIDEAIVIGSGFSAQAEKIMSPHKTFDSVEAFLQKFQPQQFSNAAILIKGARSFRMERIAQKLQKKVHGTVMEINLGAIVHNLNVFRTRIKPTTKIMAMVKAFSYGSGSHEVASILQYHQVDYLGVAYADEGKILRFNGIHLPIMVMNPTPDSFQVMLDLKLEPSVYSFALLKSMVDIVQKHEISIHLKLDTGMHRLGFEEADLDEALVLLKAYPNIKIKSVYSHLAGSDDPTHDDFTARQAAQFSSLCSKIASNTNNEFLKHLLNSSGISRLAQYQNDMVRLGIGLYGVDPGNEVSNLLRPAVSLRATISQIKIICAGETVGYGRHGKSKSDMILATLSIGYADGYSRAFSKGVGKILVNGKLAPVVGNVCMDMIMVDITGIAAQEGEEVTIFGEDLLVSEVASWINTIPYEILTSTSDRVKRVFFAESI